MARRTRRPVAVPWAFWDASALVPLCVREGATPQAVALQRIYGSAVWWATPVEMARAFARLARMRLLDPAALAKARQLAADLSDTWLVIEPSDTIRAKAVQLIQLYDLRGADALQLAAALTWCDDTPQGRVFLTGDLRLMEAATLSGFDGQFVMERL